MTTPSTPWRIEVKFGPDGEENYAWVVADNGALIGTFKTHHAHTVANAVNAYDKHRALIETLTAALEPFAAVAEHDIGTDETAEDLFVPMREYNRVERLRVGDMRLAKAAFEAAKQEGF